MALSYGKYLFGDSCLKNAALSLRNTAADGKKIVVWEAQKVVGQSRGFSWSYFIYSQAISELNYNWVKNGLCLVHSLKTTRRILFMHLSVHHVCPSISSSPLQKVFTKYRVPPEHRCIACFYGRLEIYAHKTPSVHTSVSLDKCTRSCNHPQQGNPVPQITPFLHLLSSNHQSVFYNSCFLRML